MLQAGRRGDAAAVIEGIREAPLTRFAYAGAVVARVLGGYRMLAWRRRNMSDEEYEQELRAHHERSAQQIYDGVVRLQGLMIKIGQTIGSRPDTFPHEYVSILSRLQDNVPPRSWRVMRPHIERELGHPIADVFAEFDPAPVAAASLAQVYKARLHDGRQVAVKVVYPNIERLVRTDLAILKALIWIESKFYAFPLEPAFRELSENIPLEVDMLNEARNMEAIAELLSYRPEIVIPKVIWEHTSKRLLTMDFIEGIKVIELDRIERAGIDTQKMSRLTVDVYVEMMLRHGHMHADPHPGNLFVLPGDRLAILDFGLVKKLEPQFHQAFKTMIAAMFSGDNIGVIKGMEAAGFRLKDIGGEAFVATAAYFRAMTDPATYKDRKLMGAANDAWLKALKANPMIDMPGEIVLPMRIFSLILGLGFTTGLEVDVSEIVLKYACEPTAA